MRQRGHGRGNQHPIGAAHALGVDLFKSFIDDFALECARQIVGIQIDADHFFHQTLPF